VGEGGDTLIKKRYLMILSLTIVSVLLGSLYTYVTLADREREPTPVEVTNFPLDDEGNLKISIQPAFEVVTIIEDQPFVYTVGEEKLLCEANVEGWRKVAVYVCWSSKPSSIVGLSSLTYRFYYRTSEVPSIMISTSVAYFSFTSGEQVVSLVSTNDIYGPILGVWFGGSGTHGTIFQAEATVSLYLTR